MFEVRDHPERLSDWQAASHGEVVDWDHVFRGYRSQVDWPGARYWRELADYYPQAKVILTVRDPDDWFDSVQKTVGPFVMARGTHPSPHADAIAEMAHKAIVVPIFDDRLSDRNHATRVFRDHIADVQSTISQGRLLTFDVLEGWEPLCDFLGVDAPGSPFPVTNSSKEFSEKEWKQTT
jgi:hypothetical protein